jgi:hypothetical protein
MTHKLENSRMKTHRLIAFGCLAAMLLGPADISGQTSIEQHLTTCSEQRDRAGGLERQSFCEARPFDYSAGDPIWIEQLPRMGSIRLLGSHDEHSRIVAIVSGRAPTEEQARDLARQVQIIRVDDLFRVSGPDAGG